MPIISQGEASDQCCIVGVSTGREIASGRTKPRIDASIASAHPFTWSSWLQVRHPSVLLGFAALTFDVRENPFYRTIMKMARLKEAQREQSFSFSGMQHQSKDSGFIHRLKQAPDYCFPSQPSRSFQSHLVLYLVHCPSRVRPQDPLARAHLPGYPRPGSLLNSLLQRP